MSKKRERAHESIDSDDLYSSCNKCEASWIDTGELFCPECQSADIYRSAASSEDLFSDEIK